MKSLPVLFTAMLGLVGTWSVGSAQTKAPQPLLEVPLTLHGDIPYLQVSVNGSPPLWFCLDSGASGCIVDKAQAKALNIPEEGKAKGTGAGAGSYDLTFAKNVTYGVDKVRLTVPSSYVIDLSGVAMPAGKKMAGILGHDFFQQYVVEVDYEQGRMRLFDPKTYVYSGPGEALAIVLQKKIPFVKGKIQVAGQPLTESSWLVDTGSGDTFNDELLAKTTSPKKEVTGGIGLGQPFKVFLARAERIELGRFSFKDVNGVSGGMKIGGGVLRRFKVIFDYSRLQMILEPNRRFDEAFPTDASLLDM